MQTGPAGLEEETGEIVLRDLVKEALRMRPSIPLGEVRAAECLDLLALNSGLADFTGQRHSGRTGRP